MHESERGQAMQTARQLCEQTGTRLTPKRAAVLSILLEAKGPLSAYDLMDRYRAVQGQSLSAMSTYRMLNLLVDVGLVHKLETTNQFMACQHITCDHRHDTQFLICDRCHAVSEVTIEPAILRKLERAAAGAGYLLPTPQLELHGICQTCQKRPPKPS
jgi:Fur family zinc uptake transcriptional regulator